MEFRNFFLKWQNTIWVINGCFLVVTVVFNYLSSERTGLIPFIALFALQEEKNVATYWEGWCLLLIAILAFDRFLRRDQTTNHEMWAWLGLTVLAAGLSLDELGSIHERTPFLFTSWGLSGDMTSRIPIAIPALVSLGVTLWGMARFPHRRCLWLTLSGAALFGLVVLQEHLEVTMSWPTWTLGIRFGIEEGTELAGVFLFLMAVLSSSTNGETASALTSLVPRMELFIRLRPWLVCLTLVGCIPLALFTVAAVVVPYRGVPAAWLPFVSLNLAGLAAGIHAWQISQWRLRWLCASLFSLFFSLDQIIVFQRILDKELIRGHIEMLMLPSLAVVCLMIPSLRTRANLLILALLLSMSILFVYPAELIPRLVIPLQALGIFWVVVSGVDHGRLAPQFTNREYH